MTSTRTRIAVATGSRAEFGLLSPIMRAVRAHPSLELLTIVSGSHLVGGAETWREVESEFGIDARVEMQRERLTGRLEDARALGRGIEGMAGALEALAPDWVVVLGDRIEALAAATAASVAGVPVAHVHGGDRAEGVADEAMRHAITKLSHLHLAATPASAERIVRMGEDPARVIVTGSPAIDGLDAIAPLDDESFARLGSPEAVFLMHPVGRAIGIEREAATAALHALRRRRIVAMSPNLDPGREGIIEALQDQGAPTLAHLRRDQWIALLKRVAMEGGVIVGNSSAGLIEASALRPVPLAAVDIGPRQQGREAPATVVHVDETPASLRNGLFAAEALAATWKSGQPIPEHPYGLGRAGEHAAAAISGISPSEARGLVRKRNAY